MDHAYRSSLACIALYNPSGLGSGSADGSRQIGEIFCAGTLADDMAPIEAVLTPTLNDFVAKARANDAAYKAIHPDVNSPLVDGVPWHGFHMVVDGCSVGTVEIQHDEATVAINYSISNFPDGNYTDFIRLEGLKMDVSPNTCLGGCQHRICRRSRHTDPRLRGTVEDQITKPVVVIGHPVDRGETRETKADLQFDRYSSTTGNEASWQPWWSL